MKGKRQLPPGLFEKKLGLKGPGTFRVVGGAKEDP